jgi:hypothetical protein
MPPPKSPARINIRRNEVSSCFFPPSSASSTSQPTPNLSFWNKILKVHSQIDHVKMSKLKDEVAKTGMYDGANEELGRESGSGFEHGGLWEWG